MLSADTSVGGDSSLGLDGEAGPALSVLVEGWVGDVSVDTPEVLV